MKERMVVRRNIIDIEAAERDLQVKLYRKVVHKVKLFFKLAATLPTKCLSKINSPLSKRVENWGKSERMFTCGIVWGVHKFENKCM